jgi:hypothetical protein
MSRISKWPFIYLAVGAIAFMPYTNAFSQDKKAEKKKEEASKIRAAVVDSQHYVFIAQSALPMGADTKQLTSEYDVVVSKSKIVSFLPYFGRAFTADYGSNTSPLDFTSTDFTYSIIDRKKGGWEVNIDTKDVKGTTKFSFTIFENGSATLSVNNSNRQPILFNGYVQPVKSNNENKN